MDLVKIDVVRAQSAQAGFNLLDEIVAGEASAVGAIAHCHATLGGDHQMIPTTAVQCLSEYLLGHAIGIAVGGVDEIDAMFDGDVEESLCVGDVAVANVGEHASSP